MKIALSPDAREADTARPAPALWQLGFRPFYLLASVFAALSIGLWAAQFAGWLDRPYLSGPLWHAHEMLFGFALAVVVGFLFTAGRNWSNRPTPTGAPLAALAILWLAGRVLVATPFGWAAAVVDSSFALAAAIGLAIPLRASNNRRNYVFVAFLLLMGGANLAFHLSHLGVLHVDAGVSLRVALDMMLLVMALMAGRVIPMFTNNAIAGAGASSHAALEKLALGSLLVLCAADAFQVAGVGLALVALACAVAHGLRLAFWRPWKTGRTPLVWILHAAYAWIVLHLLLRAASEVVGIPGNAATHALTVGGIGALMIGMMVRTTRGHTGRPLVADRADVACFALVLLAAALRVLVPLAAPAQMRFAVIGSAILWCAGFALFAVRYAPVLMRADATASRAERRRRSRWSHGSHPSLPSRLRAFGSAAKGSPLRPSCSRRCTSPRRRPACPETARSRRPRRWLCPGTRWQVAQVCVGTCFGYFFASTLVESSL